MRFGKVISGKLQLLSLLFSIVSAPAQSPHLAVKYNATNGLPYFSAPGTNANAVYKLQVSTNLLNWTDAGSFLQNIAPYADLSAAKHPSRFYRVVQLPKTATNDFENQLKSTWPLGKFLISLDQPDLVYFHRFDTFHYQFASQRLPQFASLSSDQFDELALHPAHQQVLLGGIEFLTSDTIGIEFVTAEPFEPSRLVEFFKTVTSRIALPGYQFVYLPSGPERANVLTNVGYFQSQGVPIHELSEFRTNDMVQSEGWAVGTLKYIPLTDINAALAAGLITPDTILVSDGSPRDLPPISGFISLYPSSPNSHTVLRLHSQSLPYLDLPASQRSILSNKFGKTVLLSTFYTPSSPYGPGYLQYLGNPHYPPSWFSQFHLIDLETMSPDLRDELAKAKTQEPIAVPAVERFGSYARNVDQLTLSDSRFFGSKAANYSLLRKANIPAQEAIAFSFDLWLDFLEQVLPSGRPLREEIDSRMALISTNSSESVVSATLKEIRDLIEDTAQFTAEQKAAITNALSIFDSSKKIRFRSSSNAEDLPIFSAAGLYESFSGCLLDDLQPGPQDVCKCDPTDDKRRSVFRAIRKVYASFYNDQAFLERRHFNIDEATVGMALLVHYSYPDEIELANGILNADFNRERNFLPPPLDSVTIVSQRGAVSVTNPSGLDLPETYQASLFPFQPSITAFSTIRPPATPVLSFPDDYTRLINWVQLVKDYFPWFQYPEVKRLNFEFKKTPTGLSIKQMRPVFTPTNTAPPMVLSGKATFRTFQGMGFSAEASHASKSVLEVESEGWVPKAPKDSAPIFARCRRIYVLNDHIVTNDFVFQSGGYSGINIPSSFVGGLFSGVPGGVTYATNRYTGQSDSPVQFRFLFPAFVPIQKPFLDLSDLVLDFDLPPGSRLVADLEFSPLSTDFYAPMDLKTVEIETNSVSVLCEFWRNLHPSSAWIGIGPTFNLAKWETTTISGLTTEPIVLKGFFSQTYSTGRHNFGEYFLFEPGLEEGISSQQLAELNAANIKQIYVEQYNAMTPPSGKIELIGFDGQRRPVSASP